jgi:hypothetical protein
MEKSKLITIGAVIIVILAGYLGWQWYGASSDVGSVLTSSGDSASSEQAQELINFITELKTIRIETGIFTNPAFLSLVDSTVVIAPQPIGRKNPFAPLPGTPVPAVSTGR